MAHLHDHSLPRPDVGNGRSAHAHGSHGHGGHGHGGHGHGGHGFGGHGNEHLATTRIFALATGLNIAFVVVEAAYGVIANSTALLADAAHNLSDVLGLGLAWGAAAMARKKPTSRHTYGLKKTTVLAAMANAMLLLVALGGVAWEALGRFSTAHPISGSTVLTVAAIGVVINGLSAALFMRGADKDVNIRGAYLHLVADAAVSVGVVVVGAVLMWQPNWLWLDPTVSLAISLVVAIGTWRLLSESVNLSLDAVPEAIDIEHVRHSLEQLPGVITVHDLHIWAMSTSETALTAHLVVGDTAPDDLASQARATLKSAYGIGHSTLQVDTPEQAQGCQSC